MLTSSNECMAYLTSVPFTVVSIIYSNKSFIVSSLGRYVFGSEISYNKAPPRLPGLGC